MTHRKRPDTRRTNRPVKAAELRLAVDELLRITATFTPTLMSELERRSRETAIPDGYPSGGSGAGRSADATSSTERAALRRTDGVTLDPMTLAMRAIRNDIDKAWEMLIRAEDAVAFINDRDTMRRERQSSLGTCQACQRDDVPNVGNDRIRSGYCVACFTAWTRTDFGQGRQDRAAFEISRRAQDFGGVPDSVTTA